MFYYQLSHFLAPRLLLRWYSPLTSTSSLFLLPLAHWYCPACSTRALYSTRPSSSSSSLSLSLSYSFLSLTALIYFLTSSYPSFPSTSSFSTTPSGLPLSLSSSSSSSLFSGVSRPSSPHLRKLNLVFAAFAPPAPYSSLNRTGLGRAFSLGTHSSGTQLPVFNNFTNTQYYTIQHMYTRSM